MKKKLVCVLLSSAMATMLMTGCSFQLPFEKVTAESLVEDAFSREKTGVVDLDVSLDVDADVDMSELGADATMNLSLGLDANLKSNEKYGHMEGVAEVNVFGFSMKQEMETYFDYAKGIQYDFDSENDVWTYTEKDVDDDEEMGNFMSDIDVKIFKDLTLAEHKKGEDYVVKATIDFDELSELIDTDSASTDMLGSDFDLEDAVLNVEMKFDETTKEIKKMSMDIEADDIDGVELNEFNLTVSFNQIGGEIEVKIPKKVKSNAVEKDDSEVINEDILFDGDEDYGIDDFGFENPIEIDTEIVGEDESEPEPVVPAVVASNNDALGSFNGVSFNGGFDVNQFINDGWNFDETFDGIFMPADNDKFDGAYLYVYGLKNKVAMEDLKRDGVWGYELNVTYCEDTSNLPKFTFGGLTWGAKMEDIQSLYGEPSRSYSAENYDTLTYTTLDGTEVEFEVQKNNQFGINGLSAVSVINYGLMN